MKPKRNPHRANPLARLARPLLVWAACASAGSAVAAVQEANHAAALHARYAALGEQLSRSPFKRPIHIASGEAADTLRGDVYALVDHPFATVNAALSRPAPWCEVLILHINTKYCRASADPERAALKVSVGRKRPQSLDEAYPIEFAYRLAAATPQYLEVRLGAAEGPMSTRDYRIQLQAVPVDGGRTFVHLHYAYAYGFAGRIGMQTYLATAGSEKVGFTIVGKRPDGQPEYIGGMRGAVERNAMRYYLAIDAYLGALSAPPALQLEKRLQSWFAATEQYSRQLREVERTAYLDMKRSEYRRQQTVQ